MKRALARLVITSSLAAGLAAAGTATAGVAHADVTRCVGAVGVPGAFACYTSPRFDHVGLDRKTVATVPVVCYALGCTGSELQVFVPNDQVEGRFTALSYFGHTYVVYRPTAQQPYLLTSSNGRVTPAEESQVLLLSSALDAAAGV